MATPPTARGSSSPSTAYGLLWRSGVRAAHPSTNTSLHSFQSLEGVLHLPLISLPPPTSLFQPSSGANWGQRRPQAPLLSPGTTFSCPGPARQPTLQATVGTLIPPLPACGGSLKTTNQEVGGVVEGWGGAQRLRNPQHSGQNIWRSWLLAPQRQPLHLLGQGPVCPSSGSLSS